MTVLSFIREGSDVFGEKIIKWLLLHRLLGFRRHYESDCPLVWASFEGPSYKAMHRLARLGLSGLVYDEDRSYIVGREPMVELMKEHLEEGIDVAKAERQYNREARFLSRAGAAELEDIRARVAPPAILAHAVAIRFPELRDTTPGGPEIVLRYDLKGIRLGGVLSKD